MLQEISENLRTNMGDDLCPECSYYDGPNGHGRFYCNALCGWLSKYQVIANCRLKGEADEAKD